MATEYFGEVFGEPIKIGTRYGACREIQRALEDFLTVLYGIGVIDQSTGNEKISPELADRISRTKALALECIARYNPHASATDQQVPVVPSKRVAPDIDKGLKEIMDPVLYEYHRHIIEEFHLVTIGDVVEFIDAILSNPNHKYLINFSIPGSIDFADLPTIFTFNGRVRNMEHAETLFGDDTVIRTQDPTINKWRDLKAALRGPKPTMHEHLQAVGTVESDPPAPILMD